MEVIKVGNARYFGNQTPREVSVVDDNGLDTGIKIILPDETVKEISVY